MLSQLRSQKVPSSQRHRSVIQTPRVAVLLVAAAVSWCAAPARGQGFAFTSVVDSSMTVPGSAATFDNAFDVALSGDTIVFFGLDSTFTNVGIFRKTIGGSVTLVANRSTGVPGGVGTFTALQCPNISGDNIVFQGRDSNPNDVGTSIISKFTGVPLGVIANQSTVIPNAGSNRFTSLGLCPSIDGTAVAFLGLRIPNFGNANDRREGVYLRASSASPIQVIADKGTARPGLGGTFNNAPSGTGNFTNPVIKNGDVVFRGGGTSGNKSVGIYHWDGDTGTLSALIDSADAMPGATGNFSFFKRIDFDGQYIAFIAEQGDFPVTAAGVYVLDITTGTLSTVATLNTTIPGSTATFQLNNGFSSPFSAVAINDGDVYLSADEQEPGSNSALFYWPVNDQTLQRVIGGGDMLDSKEVSGIGFKSQGGGAIDGGMLAASASFTDDSFAVYLIEQDPPTCDPDNNDPEIVCPADVVTTTDPGTCIANGVDLGTPPVATDFCGVDTVVNDAPESFPVGETIVTWTITDTSGRTATCQQLATVNDTEAPTVMCAANIEVDADAGACVATNVDVPLPMSAEDNCTGEFDLDFVNDAPMAFPVGDTVVTWTVTDESMNAGTCQITVTVNDIEAPMLTCPVDITVPTDDGACSATGVTLGAPLNDDLCGAVTLSNDAPDSFPLGETMVTWTATDEAGNSTTCMQLVTVSDGEAPTITSCPADQTLQADTNCEAAVPDLAGAATATDNCDGAPTIEQDVAAGSAIGLGDTIVTLTATDADGNASTCTVTITVEANGCDNPPDDGNDPPDDGNNAPDEDGVDAATEDGAPNNGDGNNDGTPDSMQANVTSLPNSAGTYLTIVAPAGTTLADVSVNDNPDPANAPDGVEFPLGFISFTINGVAVGGTAEVTLIADLPAGETLESFWKFGPEAGAPDPHFYEFLFDGTTGATVSGNTVTIIFVDGLRGDSDTSANGSIVDPGAPARAVDDGPVTPQPTPDCGTGACATGTMSMMPLLLFGMGMMRRRRKIIRR